MQFEDKELIQFINALVMEYGQGEITLEGIEFVRNAFKGFYLEIARKVVQAGYVHEPKLKRKEPFLRDENFKIKPLSLWLKENLSDDEFNNLQPVEYNGEVGVWGDVELFFMSKHSLSVNTNSGWIEDLGRSPLLLPEDYWEVERGVNPSLGDLNWREVIYV